MKTDQKLTGLTNAEVEELRREYGFNEIREKEVTALQRLLKKVISPISLMIEIALILSAVSGQWEDFFVILVLLVVNVGIDFIQEQKAHTALTALKETLSLEATVLRNGEFITIPARELVPGDIIELVLGDVVPADAKVIDGIEIKVNQSTITGESLPVDKKVGDEIYSSSIVQKGQALARVTKIGDKTFIGKSAKLVTKAESLEESHFQKAIFMIARFLIILASVLIVFVFTYLYMQGDSLLETLRFSLVLAVASIPVALPTVLSVTMAIGVHNLAKKKAVVSNFVAIEELAGVDHLCVDKTGTLTKNQLEIVGPKTYNDFSLRDLFIYGVLTSDTANKSVIEKVIRNYAKEHGYLKEAESYVVDSFTPFNPVDKMTVVQVHHEATVHADSTEGNNIGIQNESRRKTKSNNPSKNNKIKIVIGAPQVVIAKLIDSKVREVAKRDVEKLAKDGFRTLAVARELDGSLQLVGLIPLLDLPRDDSREVIQEIRNHGVSIKMITGDNILISRYIARLLKLGQNIVGATTLHKLYKDSNSDDVFKKVEEADGFAEVTPEDKYNIVSVLQENDHIVAMTGDGVNDAPALKKADVGIAVLGASPAARSAADIVLLDSGLGVIKEAFVSAREIFSRMQSYATFRIAETIRVIIFVTLAVLVYNHAPISASMIILLALLNDIPVIAIAYDNVSINEKPLRWHMRETFFIATVLGTAGVISSFLLFWWLHFAGLSLVVIQTIMFLKLDVSGHSTLYLTRTGRKHFWNKPYPSLKFFIPAFSSRIIGTILALFGIFMAPISFKAIIAIWVYSTFWFVVNDQIKVLSYKFLDFIEEVVRTHKGNS